MSRRNVDTDYVRSAVDQLKTLKKECEEQRDLKVDLAEKDRGRVHDELVETCRILREEWTAMISLIDGTISFMSEGAYAIDETDRKSAGSLTGAHE